MDELAPRHTVCIESGGAKNSFIHEPNMCQRHLIFNYHQALMVQNAGYGYLVEGMARNLRGEKNRFEADVRPQMASNHTRMVQPSMDQLDDIFQALLGVDNA